jgi:hypothetical protein
MNARLQTICSATPEAQLNTTNYAPRIWVLARSHRMDRRVTLGESMVWGVQREPGPAPDAVQRDRHGHG